MISDWKTAWWLGLGISHRYILYKIQNMKETEEKIKYKGKCIKMSERTWQVLKDKRKRSGLSWNRFLVELLKEKTR